MSAFKNIVKEMALTLLKARINWIFDELNARAMKSVAKFNPEVAALASAELKRKRQKEIARFIRRLERKL